MLQHQKFPKDSNPKYSGHELERSHRAEVTLMCEVRQGTGPWAMVRLEDISEQGFRIAWLPNRRPDQALRIKIPGLQLLSANIRWQEGHTMGCVFENPLHISVFENIVRQAAIGT